ncbi:MAG: transposase [Candidatus Zhuqueibacterota bacterium]
MSVKITKNKFIEAIENNEQGLTNIELATKLGISEQYFYDLKKKYRDDLKETASEMIQKYAIDLVRDLITQSRKGKTEATKIALEMIGLYKNIDKGKERKDEDIVRIYIPQKARTKNDYFKRENKQHLY